MKPVENVLKDADMQKKEIDEIVLVGGSTRIPKIQQLVKNFFDNKEPSKGKFHAICFQVHVIIWAHCLSQMWDNLVLIFTLINLMIVSLISLFELFVLFHQA